MNRFFYFIPLISMGLLTATSAMGETGPDGVDSRITLTPVTDGSYDWEYTPVLRHHDIAGPSEIACIIRVPDWVPLDKRPDPTANYYIYHSNHGGPSIAMEWAASMEDLCAGNLHRVDSFDLETTKLVQDPGTNTYSRVPATITMDGAIDLEPLNINHVSAPDVYVDHSNQCFIMFFHGWDKEQFLDLDPAVIQAAGGINKIGKHTHFVATSPYGRNFNPPQINGIECGGYEGFGPVFSVDGYFHDNRRRMVVFGHDYGKRLEQHGRPYTMGREGRLSRAPETNPYNPGANGHTGYSNYWPIEDAFNNISAVSDWFKGSGVVHAEHLKIANHPNNPNPGTSATKDINHVANNRISDTHFEVFVITKGTDFPCIYRVVLDATSENWDDWHLEHDENGVIFDVVIDPATMFDDYNALHGSSLTASLLADPVVFTDNPGTENERRYLMFSCGMRGLFDGESVGNALGIFELIPMNPGAPSASAGADIVVTDTDESGFETVLLDGSASSDSDGSITSYVWEVDGTPVATGVSTNYNAPVGTTTVQLTVTDNEGNADTDTVEITVNSGANVPPVADAGSAIYATDSNTNGFETVTLDGSGSTDSDGTITSFVWRINSTEIATGVSASYDAPVGTTTIELTVTDDQGATGTDTVDVTIYNGLSGSGLIVSNGTFNIAPAKQGDYRDPADVPALETGKWFVNNKGGGLDYNAASNWIESSEGSRRVMAQAIDIEAGTDAGSYILKFDWMHEPTPANNGVLEYAVYTTTSNSPTWNGLVFEQVLPEALNDWERVAYGKIATNASAPWATARLDFTVGMNNEWVAIAIMADNSSDGSGKLTIDNVMITAAQTTPSEPSAEFKAWIEPFYPGQVDPFNEPVVGFNRDPDGDRIINGVEFALMCNPAVSNAGSTVVSDASDSGFTITLPVRQTAVFSPDGNNMAASTDGVNYFIYGSTNIAEGFSTIPVQEVVPAKDEILPAPETGYSYRTFRIEGWHPQGFMRVGIGETE